MLVGTGNHISHRKRKRTERHRVGAAKACNKDIHLYNLNLSSVKINDNCYSYHSFSDDVPYPILGMDFKLTLVRTINFDTNLLVFDGTESLLTANDRSYLKKKFLGLQNFSFY